MPIIETVAKTILRKQKQIDSWFCSSYGMNLYRGCVHNCTYCDGRSESYYVEGDFGSDIEVKVHAPKILFRELDPARKRKPMRKGFILLGGGVNDCYQPAEKKYLLARQTLELIHDFGHPVHVLTKSALAERDLDLLTAINEGSRAVVSVSISTADDSLAAYFEPGASPPSKRLELIRKCKSAGLFCGVYLLPLLPFITDTPEMIDRSFQAVRDAEADFVIFGGLTLKEGRQKEYFMNKLSGFKTDLPHQYDILYRGDRWGNPVPEYAAMLHDLLFKAAAHYGIPVRMPPAVYGPVVDENGLVQIALEHLDYIQKSRGLKSTFGYAARGVAKLDVPISSMRGRLRQITGIGPATEKIVRELIETGSSRYYEDMIRFT